MKRKSKKKKIKIHSTVDVIIYEKVFLFFGLFFAFIFVANESQRKQENKLSSDCESHECVDASERIEIYLIANVSAQANKSWRVCFMFHFSFSLLYFPFLCRSTEFHYFSFLLLLLRCPSIIIIQPHGCVCTC